MHAKYRQLQKITDMHKLFCILPENHIIFMATILGVLDVSEITHFKEVCQDFSEVNAMQ